MKLLSISIILLTSSIFFTTDTFAWHYNDAQKTSLDYRGNSESKQLGHADINGKSTEIFWNESNRQLTFDNGQPIELSETQTPMIIFNKTYIWDRADRSFTQLGTKKANRTRK